MYFVTEAGTDPAALVLVRPAHCHRVRYLRLSYQRIDAADGASMCPPNL